MRMMASIQLLTCLVLLQSAPRAKTAQAFHWEWRGAQELFAAQSLRNDRISESAKHAIGKAIEEQLRPNVTDLEIHSEGELWRAALDTRVKMIDLNHDGILEVVAQAVADCSATGNCSFWIFQKAGRGYKLLLKGFGQTFTIQKGSTNGFQDIVVAMHGSATDSGLTLYQYKKGIYDDVACYDADWAPLENGVVHELKEPRITPCGSK
jgi:hypothetical protein